MSDLAQSVASMASAASCASTSTSTVVGADKTRIVLEIIAYSITCASVC